MGPVVLWAAVIFAFSSIPSLGTGLGTWDLILRKIAHLSEYAILGALLVRAIQRPAVAILARRRSTRVTTSSTSTSSAAATRPGTTS